MGNLRNPVDILKRRCLTGCPTNSVKSIAAHLTSLSCLRRQSLHWGCRSCCRINSMKGIINTIIVDHYYNYQLIQWLAEEVNSDGDGPLWKLSVWAGDAWCVTVPRVDCRTPAQSDQAPRAETGSDDSSRWQFTVSMYLHTSTTTQRPLHVP